MAELNVENIVVCDDVRKEITGKDILIGAYSSGISIQQFPATLNLAVWLEIRPKRIGQLMIEIRIEFPGDGHAEFKMAAKVEKVGETFSAFTPQIGYPMLKEGELKVLAKSERDKQWRLLKRLMISCLPSLVPAA